MYSFIFYGLLFFLSWKLAESHRVRLNFLVALSSIDKMIDNFISFSYNNYKDTVSLAVEGETDSSLVNDVKFDRRRRRGQLLSTRVNSTLFGGLIQWWAENFDLRRGMFLGRQRQNHLRP